MIPTTKLLPRGAVAAAALRRAALPSTSNAIHSTTATMRAATQQPEVDDKLPKAKSNSSKPPQPKISNQSVPGIDREDALSEEAKEEVRRHNEDFDKKHDRAAPAPGDKVNKSFWSR